MCVLVGSKHKRMFASERISGAWMVTRQRQRIWVTYTGVLERILSSLAGAQFPADCGARDVQQGAKAQEAEKENAPQPVQKHAKGWGKVLCSPYPVD